MISVAQSGKCIGRRSAREVLLENMLKTFNDKGFNGCPAAGGGNFGAFQ